MGDEVSNELAEIKALVQHQIQASEARHTENVRQQAEMRQTLSGVVSQVFALDARLGKNEKLTSEASNAARKALDSHDELKGALMVEVGALASNDQKQNEALKAIRVETFAQSSTLDAQTTTLDALVASESTRKTREDVVFWILTRALPAVAVGTGGAIVWLVTHYH